MPHPPKELYTIADASERWGVTTDIIEDYLRSGKLQASVHLPRKMMHKYTRQPTECSFSDEVDVFDVDSCDPYSYMPQQGVFNLCYEDVNWDEAGKATLEKGGLYLSRPDDEEKCYYGFDEDFVLSRDKVYVSISELTRFEGEYGTTPRTEQQDCPEKVVKVSQDANPELHPKEKESLLKIVIAIAIGFYEFDPAKKKSPIANKITNLVYDLGLSIDVDTVRKWLKEAAEIVPRKKHKITPELLSDFGIPPHAKDD
uniref:Uncharacterized protein n=1 Tax=Geobacter metallireducens TaxID=28232 RepID=A0A831U447_GEOME